MLWQAGQAVGSKSDNSHRQWPEWRGPLVRH
jgi:hypothetical protein